MKQTYSAHMVDNTKYCKEHNCLYSASCPHCSKEKRDRDKSKKKKL